MLFKKIALMAIFCSFAFGCDYRVFYITDGDTFKVLDKDNKQIIVRIYGIDSPERKEPYYKRAKQHLSDLIYKKCVNLEKLYFDRWKRQVAKVYLDNIDVGAQMVSDGFAWDFKKYSKGEYAPQEEAAKKAKLGIWHE